jgi:hypothetical protein
MVQREGLAHRSGIDHDPKWIRSVVGKDELAAVDGLPRAELALTVQCACRIEEMTGRLFFTASSCFTSSTPSMNFGNSSNCVHWL